MVVGTPVPWDELTWLCRLDIWFSRFWVVSRYTTAPTAVTKIRRIESPRADDIPLFLLGWILIWAQNDSNRVKAWPLDFRDWRPLLPGQSGR